MSIVTLTTDLGYRDPYLALVKAKLLSQTENVHIIDLSCEIKDNNISQAAYILKTSLPHFPQGTIHLVGVKFLVERSKLNKENNIDNSRFLITNYKNQIIICPDNGLFTLIDAGFNESVYQLYYNDDTQRHFFLKDVFVDAATHLLKKNQIDDIATLTNDYYKAFGFESYLSGNILRGKGIYVDDFGNIVCNITKEKFNEIVGNRAFSITLPGILLREIRNTYDEVKYGEPLVLFNGFGYLELAINGINAFQMLLRRRMGLRVFLNLVIGIND